MSKISRSLSAEATRRKLYGRKQGRPLNKARADALDTLLPALRIPDTDLTQNHALDPQKLFSKKCNEYWLEIGFGNGEHVAGLMERRPDFGFIAAEPFINGMAAFLKNIKDKPHNARVLMDDGMIVARSLKENSLEGIYILNPDPWPKKRHHKRRIVCKENLDVFAKILKPGGRLILSTDVSDLADWMVTHTFNHMAFTWAANSADDWRIPPEDWIPTRYEVKKARNSSKMCYLLFERV